MSLTATNAIIEVHGLLGQSSANAATKFVSDAEITIYLNAGIRLMCQRGKVYQKQVTAGATTGYTMAYSAIDADDTNILEIISIELSNEALTRIPVERAGKTFTVGTTPLWYYTFGNLVKFYPALPTDSTPTVNYFAVPSGEFNTTGTDADYTDMNEHFEIQHEHRPVAFAAAMGFLALARPADASVQLSIFAQGLDIDVNDIKLELNLASGQQ